MELFRCPACGATMFFRNLVCLCGAEVAYDPDARRFEALDAAAPCANREPIRCNWRAEGEGGLCRSCAATRTIPDLGVDDNAELWEEAEEAKRWALANLMRWGLLGPDDPGPAPIFDLLSEDTREGEVFVSMGHASGVIVINVAEADPAVREARRAKLGERYRTMVGHFRHEISHFLHERLMNADGFAEAFRGLFGDERLDYQAALKRHYVEGPPPGFQQRYLTPYAAAHPHEDWAETAAHALHLVDMVDSAAATGFCAPPEGFDAYDACEADTLLALSAEISVAVNHVNRAMGMRDVYPFALGPATREKLAFAMRWLPRASRC